MKSKKTLEINTEIQKFKEQFEKLKGSLPSEAKILFEFLLEFISILASALHQKLNPKNSRNSHMPPSLDKERKKGREGKTKKKIGAPKNHKGGTLQQVPNPNVIVSCPVLCCSSCDGDLRDRTALQPLKRQVFDVEMKVVVTEYQGEIKECSCGEKTESMFPAFVNAPVQYGPSVKALAVYMNQYQMIPLSRTQEFFEHKIGLPVSESSILTFNKQAFTKLEGFEGALKEDLLKSYLLHGDETGININSKGHWVHILSNEKFTLYQVHQKRGTEAMDAMGILTKYRGILIHDCWGSYFIYDCIHALCGAHLIRELTYAHEVDGQKWALKMKKLLLGTLEDREKGPIDYDCIQKVEESYSKIIRGAEKECPRNEKRKGERGRISQSKSRNLLDRLIEHRTLVLLFLYCEEVPFTNNQGERDLRMNKVKQKISGGFRTLEGAKIYCRIRSYLSTKKKQGVPAKEALKLLFSQGP